MTESEFQQEARRVLLAFGLEIEEPLQIKHTVKTDLIYHESKWMREFFSFHSIGDSFRFCISRKLTRAGNEFNLVIYDTSTPNHGSIYFCQNLTEGRIEHPAHPHRHISLMLRVLSNLGYDVVSLCDQANIPLSTHHRIELALKHRQENQTQLLDEAEFQQEARHILNAFGFPTRDALEIDNGIKPHRHLRKLVGVNSHRSKLATARRYIGELIKDNPRQLEFRIEDANFRLIIYRKRKATASDPFSLIMEYLENGGIAFITQLMPERVVYAEAIPKHNRFKSLLLNGLGKLGYDVVSLCEQFNISLSDQEKRDSTAKYQQTRKTPTIKAEFERETQRILAAFGQDPQTPLEIKYNLDVQFYQEEFKKEDYAHFLEFSFATDSFILHAGRTINTDDDTFFIRLIEPQIPNQAGRNIALFTHSAHEQYIFTGWDHEYQCQPFLLRALANLDYDIVSICEHSGFDLTAHEKIEMALKYRKTNPIPKL